MANRHTEGEPANPDAFLSVGDLATEWGVSVRTIQRYIANGRLVTSKLPSGHHRIRRADADLAKAEATA